MDEPRQELVQKQATVDAVCIVPDSMCQGHQESNDAAADNQVFEFEGKIRYHFAWIPNLLQRQVVFVSMKLTKICVNNKN